MTMVLTKITAKLSALVVAAGLAFVGSVAMASDDEEATPHYPLMKPKEQSWSFSGPFGHYDQGQLQRGLKIYTESCAACHSLRLIAYRNLEDLGYSEEQIKNFAGEYEVPAGPNEDGETVDEDGELLMRKAKPADRFKSPFANEAAAKAGNNGALPPDLSLIAKARAPERGFPTFIFDIFTMYGENGADYIYSLLTGYQDAPEGTEVLEGLHYNPYFVSGHALAMAPPLSDGTVDYDDGTKNTLDQHAKDIAAFLTWAADPNLNQRKQRGFIVMLFLIVFAGLMYFTKKKVWSDVSH